MDILFTAKCYLISKEMAEQIEKDPVQLALEDFHMNQWLLTKHPDPILIAVHIARLPERGEMQASPVPCRSNDSERALQSSGSESVR
jgi:hypothetical protein